MTPAIIPAVATVNMAHVAPAHKIAVPGRPDVVLVCSDRDTADRVAQLLGGDERG